MSQTIHPARRYRFVVEATVPPCMFDDHELALYLAAQRSILLGAMMASMAALPFQAEHAASIQIEPVGAMQ